MAKRSPKSANSPRTPPGVGLRLRLLGPLSVSREGKALALPASRKTRALLAWLAMTPRAAARQQLCELLWDTSADPRGELRWSLTKVRAVVDDRISTCDDTVRLDLTGCFVDAFDVERAARAGIRSLSTERARALLNLFDGDVLEGLQVHDCPEFTSWLLAQRRRFRAWHVALIERVADSVPDAEAFDLLERWLALAPFDLGAHERLFGALVRRGRLREADDHLSASARLFEAEGLDCTGLRAAWRAARVRKVASLRGRTTADGAQAYEYYLQGRQFLQRMMQIGLDTSREMFVRSIELDASYGPAWAGLATVHACLHEWFGAGLEGAARVRQASLRAFEVAPRLAETHVATGLALSAARRYDEAAGEFEEAIRLNPDLFDAWYYFGRTSFASGDMARAARLFGTAAELRSEDFQSPILRGMALRAISREDAAFEAETIGIHRAERVLELNPLDGRALSLGAGALVDNGQIERALLWSRRSLELHPDDMSALVNGACVQARVGNRDEALNLLERVFSRGCGQADWIRNDSDYSSLRDDERFQRLFASLG